MNSIILKQVSSLEKVFPDIEPICNEIFSASALKGEEYSYQIAYTKESDGWVEKSEAEITVDSPVSDYIKVRKVMNVPSEVSCYKHSCDDGYYTLKSGLFPDALIPLENGKIYVVPDKWNSLWVDIEIADNAISGIFPIEIIFDFGDYSVKKEFKLEIINKTLKKQDFIFTQWFHCDCIADLHNVGIFSEKHWELIGKYINTAVKNGINMILTPVFTPPLDTEIGGERPTVQLIDCFFDGKYTFKFDKLDKWIDLCLENGIEYFEISHLFTQWGAKYAPKIIVEENGEKIKKFGWHTAADSVEYKEFLSVLLPELTSLLSEKGIKEKVYFHISDEPGENDYISYKKALETVSPYLNGFKRIDALSDVGFYKKRLIDIPVPSNDRIDDFLNEDISERWTYYCCGQGKNVSNRFFSMPSARNRIIGAQFYKFNIKGFLHWGYNFYYSQYSKEVIDPYITTDSCGAFPSGDAFSVYPYKDAVVESIRLKVFKEALQDLRAMKMLEEIRGRKYVLKIIEEECGGELKFDKFPFWGDYILSYRERINEELKKVHKKLI